MPLNKITNVDQYWREAHWIK